MFLEIILPGILGMTGGFVRASIGLFKALDSKMEIDYRHWGITAAISGMIGVVTGMVFSMEFRLAMLAGYAGMDLLDGIYKVFKVEKVVVLKK